MDSQTQAMWLMTISVLLLILITSPPAALIFIGLGMLAMILVIFYYGDDEFW